MHQVQTLLRKIYRGVGTSRAKRLERLLDRGEWALLQKESMSDPRVYQNAGAYLRDALVVEIARKLLLPGDNDARREAAEAVFWSCEAQCAATNVRLSRFIGNQGPFTDPSDLRVAEFISQWRKNVTRVLGPLPQDLTPKFSGGSTLSDKGIETTIPDKMSSQPTMYEGGLDVARYCFRKSYADMYVPTAVRHNEFFTVPKDSQKDRGCCMEASMAVSLQLAVGSHLKRRYAVSYQVDLRHAKPIHQSMSQRASIDGKHATIDLSNASDTVASVLIKLLLPDLWYDLLNSLRAGFTKIGDRFKRLEKFSSMGNGFTFELETIVFRTLAETLGCSNEQTWVFGDDIIIPTEQSSDLMAALRFFGFTPNPKKTFCEGPFRESCGGDFFRGVPVRAHYLETLPDEPQKWISLANGLRRADPQLAYYKAAWWYCIDCIPAKYRIFTSCEALGDGAIFDPDAKPTIRRTAFRDPRTGCEDESTVQYLPHWQILRSLPKTVSRNRFHPDVQIASAILGVEERVPLRKSVAGWKLSWVLAWGVTDTDPQVELFR